MERKRVFFLARRLDGEAVKECDMPGKKDNGESLAGRVSEEEWQLRVDLAAAYRMIAHLGWDDLIFTHLSARVPGPDKHFLINPFGLLFEEITASNLVKIDLDGSPVGPTNYPVNPAGFVIHGAVHEAREDAHCVLHIHTVEGMAVSAQEEGLLPITQTAMTLYGDVAYHDYEGILLDQEEKGRLLTALGNSHNLILRNHGLLTVGETVGDAFLRLFFLQKACIAQVQAQAGGGRLIRCSEETGQRVALQTNTGFPTIGPMSWQAIVRKVERLDPGFAT
jgi:ribulose-5-phosphate 4-epimerase/fuculose-1-phosphate aldolase